MLDVLTLLWMLFYIAFVYSMSVNLARLACGPRAWWGHRAWAWVPLAFVIGVVFIQLLLAPCGRLPDVMP